MRRRIVVINPAWLVAAVALILLQIVGCTEPTKPSTRIPSNISLKINEDAEATRDTVLQITINGSNIYEMQISDDSTLIETAWEPFEPYRSFTFNFFTDN